MVIVGKFHFLRGKLSCVSFYWLLIWNVCVTGSFLDVVRIRAS